MKIWSSKLESTKYNELGKFRTYLQIPKMKVKWALIGRNSIFFIFCVFRNDIPRLGIQLLEFPVLECLIKCRLLPGVAFWEEGGMISLPLSDSVIFLFLVFFHSRGGNTRFWLVHNYYIKIKSKLAEFTRCSHEADEDKEKGIRVASPARFLFLV